MTPARTEYVPTCPDCDWEGQRTQDPLVALARADVHISCAPVDCVWPTVEVQPDESLVAAAIREADARHA